MQRNIGLYAYPYTGIPQNAAEQALPQIPQAEQNLPYHSSRLKQRRLLRQSRLIGQHIPPRSSSDDTYTSSSSSADSSGRTDSYTSTRKGGVPQPTYSGQSANVVQDSSSSSSVYTGRRLVAENEVVLSGVRCCDVRVGIVVLLPLLLLSRALRALCVAEKIENPESAAKKPCM
jgi:hypothetical protein